MSSETYFNRDDTRIIRGIAATLMVIHHLWGFPDRIAVGNGFSSGVLLFGEPLHLYLGRFGKICVSIYMFISGYGICKSYINGKFDLLKRLKGLYFAYWKVFLIFIPAGFLFFSSQPQHCADAAFCNRFANFSAADFLSNFLGISCSYNLEWWFFSSYIVAMITFPLCFHLMDNRPVSYNLVGIIVFSILTDKVFPAVGNLENIGLLRNNPLYTNLFCQTSPFITCFWMGILMAKEDLLKVFRDSLQRNNLLHPFFDVAVLCLIPFAVNRFYGAFVDFLLVPCMIVFSLDLFSHSLLLSKVISVVGKHSTNIWLIHSFFCYYYGSFAKLVVLSGNAYLSLLTLMCLTIIASVIIEWFWKNLFMIKDGVLCTKK